MKYTSSHEWVQIDQDVATVGITQYAQEELGNIVFVQLPPVGTKLVKGQEAVVLESTKAAADIYSPVSGEVIEKNALLENDPSLINTFPESQGWLFKLKNFESASLEGLLSQEEYEGMIRGTSK